MPYPNYHAARINNPDMYIRFVTVTNDTENFDWLPNGVIVMLGFTEDGKSEFQSIRFRKDKFTVEEAKKWLKDHNIEYIDFEPAAGEKSFDTMYSFGSQVKSDGEKLAGYLVVFSDENNPDSYGDFFSKDTDFGFADTIKCPVFFHHCLPIETKDGIIDFPHQIGEVTLRKDDYGIEIIDGVLYNWILDANDITLKRIYNTIKKALKRGLLGWSSGTAGHLVLREHVKEDIYKIKRWLLGLDASLTPMPAGAVQGTWAFIKSDNQSVILDELESACDEGNSSDSLPSQSAELKNILNQNNTKPQKEKKTMENQINIDELKKSIVDEVKNVVLDAMKSEPAVKNVPNINVKTKRGDDEVKAFEYWLRTGDSGAYKTEVPLVEGDTDSGGVLVPADFYGKIVEKRDEISFPRAAGATVITTSGKSITIPVEATVESPSSTNEGTAYDDNETKPFDEVNVTVTKYTKLVKVSEELLLDNKTNLVEFLTRKFGLKFGRLENTLATTILLAGGTEKALSAATGISATDINNLYYDLSSEYRDNAVWVMAKETEGKVRAIQGQPLVFANTPSPLLGDNVYNTASMPAIGAGNKSVIVGNMEYLALVERAAFTLKRLDERFADSGYIGFLATARLGFAVTQAEAIIVGKHPTA